MCQLVHVLHSSMAEEALGSVKLLRAILTFVDNAFET